MKLQKRLGQMFAATLVGLTLAGPAAAQLPFPTGVRGGIGIGDIISIVGAARNNNRPVWGGQQRTSKIETAIGIASILYDMNRQRQQQPQYPPNYPAPQPYPGNYPAPQPQNYPQPDPSNIPNAGGLIRPDGYEFISNNGLPVRLDPAVLPITVNAGDRRYQGVVQDALNNWNNAGLGQLFELSNGPSDLTIDWSGANVSPGARAETRMIKSAKGVVATNLSVRPDGRDGGQLVRVVTHELGHVLGLEHSRDREDVMYESEQNRNANLTSRDRQMLHWLYSQANYSPAVGQTDVQGVAAGYYGGAPTGGFIPYQNAVPVCSSH